jgi:hypothetical protein
VRAPAPRQPAASAKRNSHGPHQAAPSGLAGQRNDHGHQPGDHAGPAPSDNLVLDIGGTIGALALYTPAGRSGQEIKISPAGDDQDRTHNVVRLRKGGPTPLHVAVFPGLPAGDYTVWQDNTTPAGTVTIHGGKVTEFRLLTPAS